MITHVSLRVMIYCQIDTHFVMHKAVATLIMDKNATHRPMHDKLETISVLKIYRRRLVDDYVNVFTREGKLTC